MTIFEVLRFRLRKTASQKLTVINDTMTDETMIRIGKLLPISNNFLVFSELDVAVSQSQHSSVKRFSFLLPPIILYSRNFRITVLSTFRLFRVAVSSITSLIEKHRSAVNVL